MAKNKKRKLKRALIKNKNLQIKVCVNLYYKKLKLSPIQIKNRKKQFNKRRFWNVAMFLLNIGILAVILVINLSGEQSATTLKPEINWIYIGILGLLIIAFMLTDSLKYYLLIRKSTKKSRPFISYKTSALGKYYDNLTPMSTGGQPFQMVYLNKNGIKGNVAASVPLTKYIFWQIVFVLVSTIILIYNASAGIVKTNVLINTVAWTSVIINLVILLTILLLSISKKIGPRIVIWVLKVLSKIKIIKNYQKTFRKVMRFVINYQKTMRYFASNFFIIVLEFFLAILDTVIWNIIPYFIYRAFLPIGIEPTLNILQVGIMSLICSLSLGFVPTPGASGGAEGLFYIIFGSTFQASGMFWPMLTWRFCTYYVFLLQGLLILFYDFIIGNRKAEKLKKLGLLEDSDEEKPTFKQELVDNREKIEIVSAQKTDKIPINLLVGSILTEKESNPTPEIITGDIVTEEEIKKTEEFTDKIILEDNVRVIKHKRKKNKRKLRSSRRKRKGKSED